jgi:hypothetical protein
MQINAKEHNNIKYIKVQLFHLLKIDLFKQTIKVFFINLPVAKLTHHPAYLAITY